MIPMNICVVCSHYMGKDGCAAFPKRIPDKILFGQHDHRQPHEGDGGIRFEPIDDREQNAT